MFYQKLCPGCGRDILDTEAYCMKCGNRNHNFDEKEFMKKNDGKTLTEWKEGECGVSHPAHRAVRDKDPKLFEDFYGDLPYCDLCGERLVFEDAGRK